MTEGKLPDKPLTNMSLSSIIFNTMNELYPLQSRPEAIPTNQLSFGNLYYLNMQFTTDYLSNGPATIKQVEITRIKTGLLKHSAVLCLQPLNDYLETIDYNGEPIDSFTGRFARNGFYLPKGLGERRYRWGVQIRDALRSAWLTDSEDPRVLLQPGF